MPDSFNAARRLVLLPDSGADLLRRELALAFRALGLDVRRAHPKGLNAPAHQDFLPGLLSAGRPALFLSVNFQGLLQGDAARLLADNGVPIAVWCVDNPWHLLCAVRDPAWKGWTLFVTDVSFIAPLKAAGARSVFHLPLAACPESMGPQAERDATFPPPADLRPLVFVGRSAFPNKERFFSGQTPPPDLTRQALALLKAGERPDFNWWMKELGLEQGALWPGKAALQAGLGAEETSLAWRGRVLAQAQKSGLTVFGDNGWQALFKGRADLRPPLDYYARLPGVYRAAEYSLNLTSLLLPAGLTQRHFDVWMAGGFCLSDSSPGLAVFPPELTAPVTFRKAEDLPALVEKFRAAPQLKRELGAAWREHIRSQHLYTHRVAKIAEACGMKRAENFPGQN